MADTAFQKDFVKAPAYPKLKTRESKPMKPVAAPAKPRAPKRMDPMLVARMLRIQGKTASNGAI